MRGAQRPRVEVRPPGAVFSAGPEVAEFAASCGLALDPWQRHVLDVGLAEGPDGLYSALEVALLCPRQNGKSWALAALVLGAVVVGSARKVLVTAHQHKTVLELYDLVLDLVKAGPFSSELGTTRRHAAETGIEFRGGRAIRFMTRSRGAGRGFTADLVVLDEAYDLEAYEVAALLPTLSSRPNPQLWYASSAPLADSEQLHLIRDRALGQTPGRLSLMEWSVEPGTPLDDRRAWAQANPSYGARLTERWVEAEYRAMLPRDFERERLGVPDERDGATGLDLSRWFDLTDPDSEAVRPLGFGLDMPPERDAAAIAVAGARLDGLVHVEVVEHLEGTAWVVPRCVELWQRWKVPMWVELGSPAAALVDQLEAKGVEVKTLGRTMAPAVLVDGIGARTLHHMGQASLNKALVGSRRKPVGDQWCWSRGSSTDDISPLVAASLAYYAATAEPAPPPKRRARVL